MTTTIGVMNKRNIIVQPIVTGGGLTPSGSVSHIVSGGGGGGSLFPNRPFTNNENDTIWDNTLVGGQSKLPTTMGSIFNNAGWRVPGGGQLPRLQIADPTLFSMPANPFASEALIGKFASGIHGQGPFTIEHHYTEPEVTQRYTYTKIWFAYPASFAEFGNAGHKTWWFMPGTSGNLKANHFWAWEKPNNRMKFVTQFGTGSTWNSPDRSGTFNVDENDFATFLSDPGRMQVGSNPVSATHGVIHTMECVMDWGTPGNCDASYQAWVDDVQVIDEDHFWCQDGLQTCTAGSRGMKWNPTWGANTNPLDQYGAIYRVYTSAHN